MDGGMGQGPPGRWANAMGNGPVGIGTTGIRLCCGCNGIVEHGKAGGQAERPMGAPPPGTWLCT